MWGLGPDRFILKAVRTHWEFTQDRKLSGPCSEKIPLSAVWLMVVGRGRVGAEDDWLLRSSARGGVVPALWGGQDGHLKGSDLRHMYLEVAPVSLASGSPVAHEGK